MRYNINWEDIIESGKPFEVNTSWPTETCLDGWEYNKTDVPSSVVIDVRKNYTYQ